MTDHPDVFWGVIASMYIGNVILLVLNLPLIPYLARILLVPRPLLISLVVVFCLIGVYAISFSTFDLYLLLAFGIIGYLMRLLKFPAAPLLLAFILGGMMEQAFRQAMTISNGNPSIFVTSPIAASMLALAFLSFIVPLIQNRKANKRKNTINHSA
jgi:putative tricarboxylic transport membrane protein